MGGGGGQPGGPHAHGNTMRQGVDDQDAEGSGQQRPNNDPRNQPPVRQLLGSSNAKMTPTGALL